jgi:hypothetical protein
MHNIIWTALFFVLATAKGIAQSCTIYPNPDIGFMENNFEEELKTYHSLVFKINGVSLNTTNDDSIEVPVNKTGFDTVSYIYQYRGQEQKDTFLCKFRAEETYIVSPCTCCGIFLMRPNKNARRGSVKFQNHSSKAYIGIASEMDYDTIPPNASTDNIHSYISMNCGFRPSRIAVAEMAYTDEKYQYLNWPEEQGALDLLMKEQAAFVLYETQYLFLHEEKLLVTIHEDSKWIELNIEE